MMSIKLNGVVRVELDVPRDETCRNFMTSNSKKKDFFSKFITQILGTSVLAKFILPNFGNFLKDSSGGKSADPFLVRYFGRFLPAGFG